MTLPLIFTKVYQTKQFGGGNLYTPSQPSVFDALADPPDTGVEAESASLADAQAVGTLLENNQMLKDKTRQRDSMLDFYDSASILRSE